MGIRKPQGAAIDLPLGFIGAQTFTNDEGNLDFSLNIPGAQVGDLIVIFFGFDAGLDDTWSWDTPSLPWRDPPLADETNGIPNSTAAYVNCAIWDGVSAIRTTGVGSTSWSALSGVIAAFRGETTFEEGAGAFGTSSMPNGPDISTGYSLYVAVGYLDDDVITMTAPAGWELAGATSHTFSTHGGSVALAYNYDGLNDPGAFGGAGNDDWVAYTVGFN